MITDAFGREIKASLDQLKNALLEDVGQQKKDSPKKDETNQHLKKLNENLDNIVGGQFNRELKALAKLIEKVAKCCEHISSSKGKSTKDLNKKTDAFGKAVARSLGKGGDFSSAMQKMIKEMSPRLNKTSDKTLNFGRVLERSQRRFATIFGMIGKDFQKTFGINVGGAIKDGLVKLNPFKWIQKEGAENNNMFRQGWDVSVKFFKDRFKGVTDSVSQEWKAFTGTVSELWKGVTDTVSGWWKSVTDTVSGLWGSLVKKVSDSWLGKTVGFVTRSVLNLGRGVAGTVKDLFRMGKGAHEVKRSAKNIDDLTAEPTKKMMEGDAADGRHPKAKGTPKSDLCKCICKCINDLIKIMKGETETTKESKAVLDKLFKGEKKNVTDMKKGKSKSEFRERTSADAMQSMAGIMQRQSGSRSKLIKEEQSQQKKEQAQSFAENRANVRRKAVGIGEGASRFIFGDKQVETLFAGAAQAVSKGAGKLIEGPLFLVGDVIEKSTIPGLTALGPIIKIFGAALGGLAEGLIHFVLTPLIEQVQHMHEASQAMFVSTGATTATPTVNMGGPPPNATGEWGTLAKRVAEFDAGMDNGAKTLEKLGTYMNDVAETGQRFSVIQKRLLTNFKKGVQDTKALNKVTMVGLQTAYLLDASAESTSDLFLDWHQRLGMSSTDLRSMQRGLTQIARSTGLVGDELIQAAKAAHGFMEDMRLAGTLTTEAARSLVELMARAKKTGTEKAAQSVAKVFSQGRLRGNLSPQEQALAAVGGGGDTQLQDAITFGVVQGNKELERRFAGNLDKWLRGQVGGDPGKSLAENMKKLSAQQMSRLSTLTQNIFGMGAEELRIQIENLQEGAKSFGDRINDLNKATKGEVMDVDKLRELAGREKGWREKFDIALKNAGNDTGKALDELLNMADLPKELRKAFQGQLSAQQADYQKQQLILTTGADLLDAFNKNVADGKKTFDQVVTELAANNQDYREYFKEIGADTTKGGEAIQKALMDQATRLEKEAKKIGAPELTAAIPKSGEIKAAIATKDTKKLVEITEEFSRIQGILQKQAKQKADPVSDIMQNVALIEGYFKQLMQSAVFEALPFIKTAIEKLEKAPFWKSFASGDMKKGFEELGSFIENLAPEVDKAMEQVAALADSKGFRKFVTGLIQGLSAVAKPFLESLGKYIRENAGDFGEFVTDMIKLIKETDWKKIGKAIGIVIGALTILATVIIGIIALFSIPGGLIIAQAVIWGIILKKVSDKVKEWWNIAVEKVKEWWNIAVEKVKEWWNTAVDTVVGWWNTAVDTVVGWWNTAVDTVVGWWNTAVDTVVGWWNGAIETIKGWWNGAIDLISSLWKAVTDNVSSLWKAVTDSVSSLWKAVTDNVSSLWKAVTDSVSGWWKAITDPFKVIIDNLKIVVDNFKSTIDGFKDAINKLNPINAITDKAKEVAPAATSALGTAVDLLNPFTAGGTMFDLAKKALSPGSIYTHDIHLEEIMEGVADDIRAIAMPMKNATTVNPILPNTDPMDEIRRRRAESQGNSSNDMSQTEINTGLTASYTRATAMLLAQIGKVMMKKSRSGNLGVDGPDYPLTAFFDEVLSTEWPNARIGRTVGLEFGLTDLA